MPANEETLPTLPIVPGYDVLRLVGQGGMGRVFLARQGRLARAVCIKLLPADPGADPASSRERFEREARLLAAASHPHVLTVLDFGVLDDGSPYLVTEYVEHGDLRKLMGASAGRILVRGDSGDDGGSDDAGDGSDDDADDSPDA